MTAAALAAVLCSACAGGGWKPYRLMAKAAQSEESAPAQVEDHRLKLEIREVLLADGLGAGITPQVYMGHVYLIGFVDSPATREAAVQAARRVSGVSSVDFYLPVADGQSSDAMAAKASDRVLEGEVKAALALTGEEVASRVDVSVLSGHAVLTGVVASDQAIEIATSSARTVKGVTGVTNFLMLPEAGFERLRPGLR